MANCSTTRGYKDENKPPFPWRQFHQISRWPTSYRRRNTDSWNMKPRRLAAVGIGWNALVICGFRKRLFLCLFSSAHVLNVNINKIQEISYNPKMAIVTAKGWCNSKMAIQRSDINIFRTRKSRITKALSCAVVFSRAHGVFHHIGNTLEKKRHIPKPFIEGVYVKIVKSFGAQVWTNL